MRRRSHLSNRLCGLVGLPMSLAAISLSGCASQSRGPAADQDTTVRVVEWSIGSGHRLVRSKRADVHLLLIPAGSSVDRGQRLTRSCVPATSVLPLGGGKRVLLVVDGRLHAVDGQQGPVLAKALGGETGPAGLRLTRLLAFSERGSTVTVLAAVRRAAAKPEELWTLSLRGDRIVGQEPARKDPAFSDSKRFFQQFVVPRCQAGGTRCVVINEMYGDSFVDVEPSRGQRRTQLLELRRMIARDVAWVPGQGDSLVLLSACEE